MVFLSAELVEDGALWRAEGRGASDSRFETHNVSSRVDGAAGSNPKSAEMRWRGWCGWLRLKARGPTPRRAWVRARLQRHSQKFPPKAPREHPSEKSKNQLWPKLPPKLPPKSPPKFPAKNFFCKNLYKGDIFGFSAIES